MKARVAAPVRLQERTEQIFLKIWKYRYLVKLQQSELQWDDITFNSVQSSLDGQQKHPRLICINIEITCKYQGKEKQ
jgi:hypothetical protein